MDLPFAARSGWAAVRADGPARRWRRWSLFAASATVTAGLCLALGLGTMRRHVDDRLQGRSLTESVGGEASFAVHLGTDTRGDRQWDVIWVEAGVDGPTPPGLAAWPRPGTFAVSPALARAIGDDAALQARYLSFTVIGDAGLQDRSERLAYATAPTGQTFGDAARRFTGFGGGVRGGDETRRPTPTILLAALVCVIGPSVLLLRTATACAADERAQRTATLHWIGAPRSHLQVLAIFETTPMVVVGAATGALASAVGLGRADRIPFTGIIPVPGDLLPPQWQIAVAAVTVAVATTALAAVRGGRRPTAGPRPRIDRAPSRWALLPAVIGLVLLAWTAARPAGSDGATPAVAATAAIILGVPLALPLLARGVGRHLATGRSPVALLAGRRIEADPVGSVRPLLGLAALLFTLLTTAGYIAAVSVTDPPPVLDAQLDAATVLSFDSSSAALGRLEAALPGDVVAPFLEDGPVMSIGTTCEDLARLIERPCGPDGQLDASAERRISTMIGRPVDDDLGLRLEPDLEPKPGGSSFVLVVGARSPDLGRRVEVAAARTLLAPQVATLANLRPQASDLWGWIRLGIAGAGSMLTLSVLISLGDRFATAVPRHRTLTRLGLDARRLRRVEAAQTAIIYALTVGVTCAAGLANAVLMARTARGAELPANLLVATVALAVLLGGLCIAMTDGTTRASLRRRP